MWTRCMHQPCTSTFHLKPPRENWGERKSYLVTIEKFFAKLKRRAEIAEICHYVSHTVTFLVRVVMTKGQRVKSNKHCVCVERWKSRLTLRHRTRAKGYLSG